MLTSITSIDTASWFHVACVRSASMVLLYVNGNIEATGSINTDLTSSGPLRIGSNREQSLSPFSPPTWPFDGNIEEVRIWNVGRTSTEIVNNVNTELDGNEPGLVSYYTFNQGVSCSSNVSTDTLVDEMSINPGDLVNFDLTGTSTDPCESNWNNSEVTSVEEKGVNSVQFYPNPVESSLMVRFSDVQYIEEVKLYTITGSLKATESVKRMISEYQLNFSLLPPGFYLIVFSDGQTNRFVQKVVKL